MKKTFFLLLITTTFLIVSQIEATVVIGGSNLESPPSFQEDSYWGMTSGLDTTYWLVGRTLQQQFNWHLADNVVGTVAYCEDQGDWVVLQNASVSAFAILGSSVPEPATLSLLALGVTLAWRKRKR